MAEDTYSEKLVWFKQNEKPEVVLLVADDPERIKLILAWSNLNVKRSEKLTELESESESDVWVWLWGNAIYSQKELAEKAGMPLSEPALDNRMKPLIGNRILYPDGTVNSFVQRYFRERVLKLFETKTKHPAKGAKR